MGQSKWAESLSDLQEQTLVSNYLHSEETDQLAPDIAFVLPHLLKLQMWQPHLFFTCLSVSYAA